MPVSERDMHNHREEMAKRSREQAESIMRLAGFEIRRVWELANGYWPLAPNYDDVRQPWWLFLTDVGLIQIGWRKRVLHIQWDACAFRGVVTEDDVTKEDTYVHAYAVEKAVEYLREMHRRAVGPLCRWCGAPPGVSCKLMPDETVPHVRSEGAPHVG